MSADREELLALRRLAELEAKAGGSTSASAPAPQAESPLKKAAPYYLGPAGPARAVSEVLGVVDELATKAAYKGGGAVTDIATNLGASPEVAAGTGVAANMAVQAIPAVLAGATAGKLASPAMTDLARRTMRSAVKPERAARLSGKADPAIDTMLQRRIYATEAGTESLADDITKLENQIQGVLNSSNATVDVQNTAMQLQRAVDKVRRSPYAVEEFQTIRDAFNRFLSHPMVAGRTNIPVAEANQLKRGFTDKVGPKAYGTGDAAKEALQNAERLANKTMGTALREGVAAAEPLVAPTLKEQSELINALKVLTPRVSVEGNKNPIGLGALSPSVRNLVVWLADRSPWFKSQLAHTAYHGASRIPAEVVGGGTMAVETVRQRLPESK